MRPRGTPEALVTDGIEAALERARDAAGAQDVRVNGGADIARQYLNAGLVDEVRLHLVPVPLGADAPKHVQKTAGFLPGRRHPFTNSRRQPEEE